MNNSPPDRRPASSASGGTELRAKIRTMGGARHLLDGAAPILGYLIGFAVYGIAAGIAAAILTALVIAAIRLRHGDRPKVVAASTALVLVFSAFAVTTGEGRGFFLAPLIIYGVLTAAFGISLLTGNPLTLPICRAIGFEPGDGGDPRARKRLHRNLTTAWTAFCTVHVLIMFPLYLADKVVLLGTVALILNKPALLAAFAGTWVWVRRAGPSTIPVATE